MRPVHRVFVTGATGFVGRAVIQALRGEGYVVRCLVRRGSEPSLRGVGAIERVEGDVLAPQLLDEGMAGCGAVVHLVGIIREHIATNTTLYRVHVQGTVNVVAAAAAAGVRRYVHMSALGAREDARSRYHRTKWAAEAVVRACGLPWTIFRPSVISGRGGWCAAPSVGCPVFRSRRTSSACSKRTGSSAPRRRSRWRSGWHRCPWRRACAGCLGDGGPVVEHLTPPRRPRAA